MKHSTLAPVSQRTPMGFKEVMATLQDDHKMNLGGIWRWLHQQGEIDSPSPPEDLDPVIKLMEHASRNHDDAHKHACKICAVWMVLWECCQVAENFGNTILKAVGHLEPLLRELALTDKKLFGKGHYLLRTMERPRAAQEVRRSGGRTANIYDLNKIIEPKSPGKAKDEIVECEKRVSVSIRRLHKDLFTLSKALKAVYRSPGVVYVHPKDEDYLMSKVAYDLWDAGFDLIEITDMLNGEKPLTCDEVGDEKELSHGSDLKVRSIEKRIRRFAKLVNEKERDAD